jgi:hypothetical protein
MRRDHPELKVTGPCTQRYWPSEVDDEGNEALVGKDKVICAGEMIHMLNASGSVCNKCFHMVAEWKPKPADKLIEAPGAFRARR